MKIKIVLFVLPQEIDLYEATVRQLKLNSLALSKGREVEVDATLCLSDELTDWEKSDISRSYFVDKFRYLEKFLDWCEVNHTIEYGNKVLGCVSKRRESSRNLENVDTVIWLDCDMVFPNHLLSTIFDSVEFLKVNSPYYILTPELVKIWDNTWDILVNSNYINEPHDFNQKCDIFDISNRQRETMLLEAIPTFKFAGGWVTTISADILRIAQIPDELGHYGLEDMFIADVCNILRSKGTIRPQQFVIRNLIAGENHRYRDDSYITDHLKCIDRKDEYRKVAWSNYKNSLERFVRNI